MWEIFAWNRILPITCVHRDRGSACFGKLSQMHGFRRRNPLLRVEGLLKVLESTISTKFRIMFIKIDTFDLAWRLSSCRARDWDAQGCWGVKESYWNWPVCIFVLNWALQRYLSRWVHNCSFLSRHLYFLCACNNASHIKLLFIGLKVWKLFTSYKPLY